MTTKVQKWGNSLALRIPKKFAENLNLQAGSPVAFKQSGENIIITSSRPKYTLQELVKGISKKNRHKIAWPDDAPRGKEIW
jgi:antitoxin MazE